MNNNNHWFANSTWCLPGCWAHLNMCKKCAEEGGEAPVWSIRVQVMMTPGWSKMTDHLLFTQLNYKGFNVDHTSIQFRKEETWSRCSLLLFISEMFMFMLQRLCHCLCSQQSPGQISPLERATLMIMTTLPLSSREQPPVSHSQGEGGNKTSSTQTSDQSGWLYLLL